MLMKGCGHYFQGCGSEVFVVGIPGDHLGIRSEYAPFLVNTLFWALQNLRLVGEYGAPRSPFLILITEIDRVDANMGGPGGRTWLLELTGAGGAHHRDRPTDRPTD